MIFQSTLPRRERRGYEYSYIPASYFNPRSREGSDAENITNADNNVRISIHAPAKGATCLLNVQIPCYLVFQSTLPRRERQWTDIIFRRMSKYFNPRSREGSDNKVLLKGAIQNISIHAPAKGATLRHRSMLDCMVISIHAPAKGATTFNVDGMIKEFKFQSTLPRRERRK